MEDQLWKALYPLIEQEDKRRPRLKRVQFSDAMVLAVVILAAAACGTDIVDWPGRAT